METLFPHYAHLDSRAVKTGDIVQKGQIIGRVGKTGNAGTAHCHFDCRLDVYGGVNFYPQWYHTKGFIQSHYMNPGLYLARPQVHRPMVFDKLGYGFLSWTGRQYHPGWDLNRGGGDSDLRDPVYATEYARVFYSGVDSGWGHHILLETMVLETVTDQEIQSFFRNIWGKAPAYGDWFYFRRRIQLGTIKNTHTDVETKVRFNYGKFSALEAITPGEGIRWWNNEKDKVL